MTSGKKYRSQLQRVSKSEQKPFIPTDREQDILALIDLLGWLNTEHITKVFFPPRPLTEQEWLSGKEQQYYQLTLRSTRPVGVVDCWYDRQRTA